jgi:hypothetical protein
MSQQLHLTDAELVARLTQTEDSFVERKSQSDRSGWLCTTVAFANSTPIGLPSVLFIGVSNDGQISANVDVEKTLQAFSDHIGAHTWPPIYTLARELTHAGRSCIAVIVPGSDERPHFAGRAFVRVGTQTKDASAEQFAELIASRSSKAREIQRWIGKDISWIERRGAQGDFQGTGRVIVSGCNSHYATFDMRPAGGTLQAVSEPLSRLELSFDHKNERLQVILYTVR